MALKRCRSEGAGALERRVTGRPGATAQANRPHRGDLVGTASRSGEGFHSESTGRKEPRMRRGVFFFEMGAKVVFSKEKNGPLGRTGKGDDGTPRPTGAPFWQQERVVATQQRSPESPWLSGRPCLRLLSLRLCFLICATGMSDLPLQAAGTDLTNLVLNRRGQGQTRTYRTVPSVFITSRPVRRGG